MTMALPLIQSGADRTHLKLSLHHLDDDIETSRRTTLRQRSSSRDVARRSRLLNMAPNTTGALTSQSQLFCESSSTHRSTVRTGAMHRSKSGGDLRALVTNRNALNTRRLNDENMKSTGMTKKTPISSAGSKGSLQSANSMNTERSKTFALLSSRKRPVLTNGNQNNNLNSSNVPRSRTEMNNLGKTSSHGSSPVNGHVESPASTPAPLRRQMVQYVNNSGCGVDSRPSSHSSTDIIQSNLRRENIYRETIIVSSTPHSRVMESNISRKEKVIHIIHGADFTQSNDATVVNDTHNGATTQENGAHSQEDRLAQSHKQMDTTQNTQASHEHCPTHQSSEGCPTHECGGLTTHKLHANRDNITPPPTPHIGLGEDGSGLTMNVFIRCVDWLEGVNKAHQEHSLDVVLLPPIKWED